MVNHRVERSHGESPSEYDSLTPHQLEAQSPSNTTVLQSNVETISLKLTKEQLARKLDDAAGDPKRFLSRLSSVEAYKLRVWEYRVILDVDWDLKRLMVLTLGHRSTIDR